MSERTGSDPAPAGGGRPSPPPGSEVQAAARRGRWRAGLAILLGAVALAWPALLNGYPLVFIDTASYLHHTTVPEPPWDKTQAYGPFLHLFHWQATLWPAVAAQALIASHLVWLAQRMARGAEGSATQGGAAPDARQAAAQPARPAAAPPARQAATPPARHAATPPTRHAATPPARQAATPGLHLLACLALGTLTSAPWFTATLMPDAFTALAPLCLLLLGFGRLSRAEAIWVGALGTLGIAVHLSHLPTALATVALVALLARRPGPVLRAAAPFGLAIALLVGANAWAFGRATLSPHGSVFLLARLQDDGPAAALLRERCPGFPPGQAWHLCAFLDRLPMDSDEFLWDGTSPLNREADGRYRPMGGVAGAAEARQIVAATIATRPVEVAAAMTRNALRQLLLVRIGDTLEDTHLAASARRLVADAFPPRELAAFDAGLQMRGALPSRAAPFAAVQPLVLALAALLAPALLWRALRAGAAGRAALLAGALVALLANAAATGALSKPHHRYQARIVWLLPLAVGLALLPAPRPAGRAAAVRGADGPGG